MASLKLLAGDWGTRPADLGVSWTGRWRFVFPRALFRSDEYFLDTDVDEVELATEESVPRIGGAAGWGLTGAALFGPAGALAGVVLGGRGRNVTFACRFRDGRRILATTDEKTWSGIHLAAIAQSLDGGVPSDQGLSGRDRRAVGSRIAALRTNGGLENTHEDDAALNVTREPTGARVEMGRREGKGWSGWLLIVPLLISATAVVVGRRGVARQQQAAGLEEARHLLASGDVERARRVLKGGEFEEDTDAAFLLGRVDRSVDSKWILKVLVRLSEEDFQAFRDGGATPRQFDLGFDGLTERAVETARRELDAATSARKEIHDRATAAGERKQQGVLQTRGQLALGREVQRGLDRLSLGQLGPPSGLNSRQRGAWHARMRAKWDAEDRAAMETIARRRALTYDQVKEAHDAYLRRLMR